MRMLIVILAVVGLCFCGTSVFAQGNDAYTTLLLHSDGTNGSTTFTDSSSSNHPISVEGDVHVDTANKVFGTGSAQFNESGRLVTPDSEDWNFGRGNFTIDFWVKFNRQPGSDPSDNVDFIGQYDGPVVSGNRWDVQYDNERLAFWWNSGGVTQLDSWSPWDPLADTWYHIAIVRDDTHIFKFINGQLVPPTMGYVMDVGDTTFGDIGGDLHIGENAQDFYMYGSMDEIRVSTGIARWTSDFTLPTEPYSAPVPEPTTLSLLGLGLLGLIFKRKQAA